MSASESANIKEVITEYFQLAKTKEIEKIDSFLDPKFTKFGDSPPYDRREFERALMLEQLQFASISDYDFKINDLKIEVKNDSAVATFLLESTGMIVDDYSFRGTTINNKSRTTVVLQKDDKGRWKMIHQHLSAFSG
ncbi:MAG TPA: nuclear transport factor 2 family protein [Nitrososphaera sp.]|nr:nuclear transport factor 2 family protein [Nitrososphaera sp.]